jgi:hypothetical protein
MKKKLFFFATLLVAVVAAFGLTSCSQEDMPDSPNREGMVDVVMSTSLPQGLQTYGANSAEGGLKNLEGVEGLAVRYIMEIYPKGSETAVQRMITYKNLTSDGDYRTASFCTRLLAAEYNFVFWADIVRESNTIPYNQTLEGLETPIYGNSYFYSNKNLSGEALEALYRPTDVTVSEKGDLKTIHSSGVGAAVSPVSSEMYDGYTCAKEVDLRVEPTTHSFTLKRPFAKLRVVATDKADELIMKPDWDKSLLKILPDCNIPNRFNALTGTATSDSNVGGGYWCSYYVTSGTYENETGDEHTIGVFYLPVSTSSYNLTFDMGITTGETATYNKLSVENVPLVANKLTTIKGKILSKKTDVTITIEDPFVEPGIDVEVGKEASTVNDLKAAMTGKDETITYTGKVTKDKGFELDFTNVARTNPVYAEGNTATLTLAFASIEDGAVLTFKGDNAPKTLCIKTDTKCSLRINLPKTDINYDGSAYKYIVTNAGCKTKREGAVYEVMFRAGNGSGFYSYTDTDYDESHLFKINADFTLPANIECLNDIMHQSGSCNWASSLTAGTNVWDFVGNTKN